MNVRTRLLWLSLRKPKAYNAARQMMKTSVVIAVFGLAVGAVLLAQEVPDLKPHHKFPLTKTTAEWRKLLPKKAFQVLRLKDTERPYTGEYWNNHEAGTYYCAACGQELFSSETKFDSHTGWPSFWKPIKPEVVFSTTDRSIGMVRNEVLCSRCGGHLGHVFDDGPKPTGLRYCMNSVALKFKKADTTKDLAQAGPKSKG